MSMWWQVWDKHCTLIFIFLIYLYIYICLTINKQQKKTLFYIGGFTGWGRCSSLSFLFTYYSSNLRSGRICRRRRRNIRSGGECCYCRLIFLLLSFLPQIYIYTTNKNYYWILQHNLLKKLSYHPLIILLCTLFFL